MLEPQWICILIVLRGLVMPDSDVTQSTARTYRPYVCRVEIKFTANLVHASYYVYKRRLCPVIRNLRKWVGLNE